MCKGYEPILPVVHGAVGDVPREHLAQPPGARARHRRARRRQQRVAVAATHITTHYSIFCYKQANIVSKPCRGFRGNMLGDMPSACGLKSPWCYDTWGLSPFTSSSTCMRWGQNATSVLHWFLNSRLNPAQTLHSQTLAKRGWHKHKIKLTHNFENKNFQK